jgi:hypothetical protein
MIIDEEALGVLRSKYVLPPCPHMAKGLICACEPKQFTLRACIWQGYKEARDMFPDLAETVEKLWKVARGAEEIAYMVEHVEGEEPEDTETIKRFHASLAALKEPAQ